VRKLLYLLPIAAVLLGCGDSTSAPNPPGTGSRLREDPASGAALLSNGLIGVRVSDDGNAVQDGESLPLLAIDDYDPSGEEQIRALPSPLQASVHLGSKEFLLSSAKDREERMDFRTGVLTITGTCKVTAEEGAEQSAKVRCETLVGTDDRIVAQRWTVEPSDACVLSFPPPFEQENKGIVQRETPASGIPRDTVFELPITWPSRVARCRVRVTQGVEARSADDYHAAPGRPFIAEAVWTFGTAGKGQAPAAPTFDEVAADAKSTWDERWQTDIEIDGPAEDQEAVRSFLFYLRSSIARAARRSVSPFALSHKIYGGHVFWDADIWVFPALAMIDPEAARSIPQYRIDRVPGAQENYRAWLAAKRPIAQNAYLGPAPAADALMYPWESSVTGKETVVGAWVEPMAGPSKHEAHITGSALWGLEQAASLGLADESTVRRIGRMTAEYYLQRLSKLPNGKYEIKGVMSPDENFIGKNDLYTLLLAKHAIDTYVPERFPHGIDVTLPRDAKSFLSYDGDRMTSYKQAAAILAIYPLQFPPAEKEAATMMERFPDKVIPNGPAMSQSLDALIWARLGKTDQAYAAWRRSWKEFVRPPHMLFAEKRHNGRTYFTTGAAGSLQAVLFGFLGFRIDSQKDPAASWAKKLNGERWLTIRPNLPTEWRSVKFKNFTILGHHYTLLATHRGLTVTQGD
jgi:hypothetical protein